MILSLSGDITSVAVELGFLFDGSGQISQPDFLAQLDIAKQIADTFNISDGLARVGAAIYSPNSRVLFTFNNPLDGRNRTPEAVKQLLDRTPRDQGAARLGQGLQTVDSDLFSPKGGSIDVSKVRKGKENLCYGLFSWSGYLRSFPTPLHSSSQMRDKINHRLEMTRRPRVLKLANQGFS